jgi:hypothetical protein
MTRLRCKDNWILELRFRVICAVGVPFKDSGKCFKRTHGIKGEIQATRTGTWVRLSDIEVFDFLNGESRFVGGGSEKDRQGVGFWIGKWP